MEPKELPADEPYEERIKIIQSYPPNFEKIAEVFPGARSDSVIFAYDDAIYNPHNHQIPDELIAHETVHCDRQKEIGVEEWWDRYLVDAEFRYEEEFLAHVAELKHLYFHVAETARQRQSALDHIARKLSAPLYQTKISFHRAQTDLRRAIKNG